MAVEPVAAPLPRMAARRRSDPQREQQLRAEVDLIHSETCKSSDGLASWLPMGWGRHEARAVCERVLNEHDSVTPESAVSAIEACCSSRCPASVCASALDSLRRLLVAGYLPIEVLQRCASLADAHATSQEPVGLRAVQVALAVLACESDAPDDHGNDDHGSSRGFCNLEAARLSISAVAKPIWSSRASESARSATQGALRQASSILIERAAHNRQAKASPSFAYDDAASRVLNTLAEWAAGNEGEWVKANGFPRAEAFAQLEHCVRAHSDQLRAVPALRAALAGKICPLLLSNVHERPPGLPENVVLRLVSCVLGRLHMEAHAECSMLAHALARLAEKGSLNALGATMAVLAQPRAVASLKGSELGAALVAAYESAIASATGNKQLLLPEQHVLQVDSTSSALTLSSGADSPRGDMQAHAESSNQQGRIGIALNNECSLLAIEGMLALSQSLVKLALLGKEDTARADGCDALAETWHGTLRAFSSALSRCVYGQVARSIMKGCTASAVSAGMFGFSDARDAYMATLAYHALADGDPPPHPSDNDVIGSGPLAHGLQSLDRAYYRGSSAKKRMKKSSVSERNKCAFDELASIVRSLNEQTDSGWTLLFEASAELEITFSHMNPENAETATADDVNVHPVKEKSYSSGKSCITSAEDQSQEDESCFRRFGVTVNLESVLEKDNMRLQAGRSLREVISSLIHLTPHFSDKSIYRVFLSLKQVSAREMRETAAAAVSSTSSTETTTSGQSSLRHSGKLFSLEYLHSIVACNMFRLRKLWDSYARERVHIALANGQQAIRNEGLLCLEKIINSVLTSCDDADRDVSQTSDNSGWQADLEAWCIDELYSIAFSEQLVGQVRLAALVQLQSILQARGESLKLETWRRVMSLLNDAMGSTLGSVEGAMQAAFQSVELIVQDYIGMLPADLMDQAAELVRAHCRMQTDINTSLSAVGLLWNIADFAAGDMRSSDASSRHDKALESVLKALHTLSLDERSEVRHASLRAIASTIVSHGGSLHASLWHTACIDMLLQLPTVIQAHVDRIRQGEMPEENCKAAGSNNSGIVHHSRDSMLKQWEETLSLCLSSCARVLRTHMNTMTPLNGFDERWEEFLNCCKHEFAWSSAALEIPASLCSPLACIGKGSGLKQMQLQNGLNTLAHMASEAGISARARGELATSTQRMLAAASNSSAGGGAPLTPEQFQLLIGIEEAVALANCFLDHEGNHGNRDVMLQWSSAMDALAGFPPYFSDAVSSSGTWSLLLEDLVSLAEGDMHGCRAIESVRVETQQTFDATKLAPEAQGTALLRLRERALDTFVTVYCKHSPSRARAQHLARALGILCACCSLESTSHAEGKDVPLLNAAGEALGQIVSHGLPAVNTLSMSTQEVIHVWKNILYVYRAYLSLQRHEKASHAALESLVDDVLASTAQAPSLGAQNSKTWAEDLPAALVQAVADFHRKSSTASLRKLATLCERGGKPEQAHSEYMRVAQLAMPQLLQVSQTIFKRVAVTHAGSEERLSCASDVLACADIISELEVDPRTVAKATNMGKNWSRDWRGPLHLPLMYKELVDCIPLAEQSIREAVHTLLTRAGQAMQLIEVTDANCEDEG